MLAQRVVITHTRPEHSEQVHRVIRSLYGIPDGVPFDGCMSAENIRNQITRFPEGQFVALINGKVVGYAITMRTNRSPNERPLSWKAAIGDFNLRNHEPDGKWLYGVDFAVLAAHRQCGIGTKLYHARFNLVRRLNLRGFYAGAMLPGYQKYQRRMSVHDYGQRVMRGEIKDPTVTMQINRGFKPRAVIEHYLDDPPPYRAALLIVWYNPHHRGIRRLPVAQHATL